MTGDALRLGTELGDEFVIDRVLGQGSFGITYIVRALKTINDEVRENDLCVMKEFFPRDLALRDRDGVRLQPQPDKVAAFERFRDSFAEEGRALARFFDPAVVRVFMLRQAFETAYIIMEYIEGRPFDQYLMAYAESRRRPMSTRDLMPIAAKLVDALALVHEAGLVHRDIKPANIMIRSNGDPVMIDFGGARPTERADQSVVLTPAFAPYEQHDGRNIGPWTDIYSLAATFYHALTGDLPIFLVDGKRVLVPLEQHPKRVDLGIPVEFARAIDWALDYNEPSQRPQSVHTWRSRLFPGSAPLGGGLAAGGADHQHRIGAITGPGGHGVHAPVYESQEGNWGEPPPKPRRLAVLGVVMGGVTALVALGALMFVVFNPFGAPEPEWRGAATALAGEWTRIEFVQPPPAGGSIGFTADAPFRVRIDGVVYSFVDGNTSVALPPVAPGAVVEVRAVSQDTQLDYYY